MDRLRLAWDSLGQSLGIVAWSSGRTVALLLWAGLGLLTVSLLILMRTRWGQDKPIAKCIVLSVLAHFIFAGYAYSTKLVVDVPAPDRDGPGSIRLSSVHNTDHPDHAEPAEREVQPWEEPVEDQQRPDETLPPERLPIPQETPVERTPTELADSGPQLPSADMPSESPERPTPPVAAVAAPARSEAPAEATPIDTPVERRRDDTAPAVPNGPELARLAPPTTPTDVAVDRPRASENLEELATRVQRLTERPFDSDNATARLSPIEDFQATDPTDSQPGRGARPWETPPRIARATIASPADLSTLITQAVESPPRRIGDGKEMPLAYRLRLLERSQVAATAGGNDRTEAAVQAALAWLASAQSADGRWDVRAHEGGIETLVGGQDRRGSGADADTGITGLALLAFLANGQTHLEGQYRETVQRGLEFLLRSQASDGNLGGDARLFALMYCHGMGSLALSEAFALSGDERLKTAVERAVRYTIRAQDPSGGGWRYQPGDQGDMSQFGWQVMALKSAELAGIPIPDKTRAAMHRFLQSCTRGEHRGLASYRPGERSTVPMTAEALAARFFLDFDHGPETVREASAFIVRELPGDEKPNLYCWYYATLALYQAQGELWRQWNEALQTQLLRRQRDDGRLAGSWDPTTVWGGYGGRVYSTAMATLCLEVYYRYLPLYQRTTAAEGTLRARR